MIPYEELCSALARWRAVNGPPVARAPVEVAVAEISAPAVVPAGAPRSDSIVNSAMPRRQSGPVAAPFLGRSTAPQGVAAVSAPLVAPVSAPVAAAAPPMWEPPPPEPEPLPPVDNWGETADATMDEPSLAASHEPAQEPTMVGSPLGIADPFGGADVDIDNIDVIDEEPV